MRPKQMIQHLIGLYRRYVLRWRETLDIRPVQVYVNTQTVTAQALTTRRWSWRRFGWVQDTHIELPFAPKAGAQIAVCYEITPNILPLMWQGREVSAEEYERLSKAWREYNQQTKRDLPIKPNPNHPYKPYRRY